MEYYLQLISFYYVAEFMSFTKTADYLKCSKAHISKQISALERQVGTALFNRNTRIVKLTPAGDALFLHANQIVHELQSVESTVHALQKKIQGSLRITTPRAYADHFLSPHLHHFLNQYPEISLEMQHTSEYLDFVKDRIDLAIRITHSPSLDKIAKPIGVDRTICCASTVYLQKNKAPGSPKQISQHPCLVYNLGASRQWNFLIKNEKTSVPISVRLASNNPQVILSATLNHLGIANLPLFVVQKYLDTGELSLVLPNFYLPDIPIYAMYQTSRIISPKIHAFIQFLEKVHKGSI
jgi:DNA-binding transcriptional LysR family regulator